MKVLVVLFERVIGSIRRNHDYQPAAFVENTFHFPHDLKRPLGVFQSVIADDQIDRLRGDFRNVGMHLYSEPARMFLGGWIYFNANFLLRFDAFQQPAAAASKIQDPTML